MLPSSDGIEASGFDDLNTEDILLIRNGVTISATLGASSIGGVLNVNGAPPFACWTGVTPDIRPGDIVQFITHLPDGTVSSIDQLHIMPLTTGRPVVISPGTIEIHGTAADLNGLPIPLANVRATAS